MRRTFWAASLIAALTLTAVLLLRPRPLPAEDTPAAPAQEASVKPTAPQLPITQVTLYSSGVAYMQREGEVEGDARVDLSFPVGDINDLLKSMVLQDLGGGTISAASYDSHDPLDKTLGSFAVNLTGNPSFAGLLHQARGEKVEVLLRQSSTPVTGTVIGVEPGFMDLIHGKGSWDAAPQSSPVSMRAACRKPAVSSYYQPIIGHPRKESVEDFANEPARLTLWSTEGLRSIPLTEVQRVRFVNPAMEREFNRALEVLAGAHDTQKRAVSLTFRGQGKRKVRVSYVVESPLWRTSYRLLVGKEGKLFLQGWAVVENPTSEDWKDVRLALVSGRPISFKMDLYQPLYVPRPTLQPDVIAGLQPTTHGGAIAPLPTGGIAGVPFATTYVAQPQPMMATAPVACGPASGVPMITNNVLAPQAPQYQAINLQRGVTAAATATELGDFFEYVIQHPVTLPRQKSAMLPIVNKAIEGDRVSIYNPATHPKFPLLALRLKNTSGVHLTQGPVAVFERAGYAGDAHLLDLRPGEERLVSYAVDLGTEVELLAMPPTAAATTIRIHQGFLETATKAREGCKYHLKNRSGHDRTIVVEHPFRTEYRLAGKVKPTERTRDAYRFEVKVAAGKSASLDVVEERNLAGRMTLCSCEEQALHQLLKGAAEDDKVKQAIAKALDLKAKLSATQRELARRQAQLQEIAQDQQRLRANLKEMPQTAAAYKRYLEKFDRQETEIERLQAQVREYQDSEAKQRQEYEAYWGKVDVGPTPIRTPLAIPAVSCPAPTSAAVPCPPPAPQVAPVPPSYTR